MVEQAAARRGVPWLLSLPAVALFVALLAVPMLLTAMLSFSAFEGMSGIQPGFSLGNYLSVLTDGYYLEIFWRTAGMALGVTFICVVIGVPETLILARMRPLWRGVFFVVILGPLLISVVVRTLGWSILLGNDGPVNTLLRQLHLVENPVRLMFSMTGVIIVLTHVLLPFMIIAVWSALHKLDGQVDHAARSLGAGAATSFRRIVLPQLMPAILLLLANILVIVGCNRLVERRFKQVFA